MTTVSTFGAPGGTSSATDPGALFLKLFGSEVLASFEETSVMRDKHMIKQISNGKSATFPAVGRASASYHAQGADILSGSTYLTAMAHNERVIIVDEMLQSSVFITEIAELRNHWETRQEYARQIGFALGTKFDKQVLKTVGLAARAAEVVAGDFGDLSAATDKQVTAGNMETQGSDLMEALFDSAERLDRMHVPDASDGRRWAVVKPGMYYNLLSVAPANTTVASPADSRVGGGASVMQSAPAPITVAGIKVVSSTHIDNAAAGSAETGTYTNYDEVDSAAISGFVFHESAVGTAQLRDLVVTQDWIPENLGTLLVGRMAVGHNYLRANASIELNTTAWT